MKTCHECEKEINQHFYIMMHNEVNDKNDINRYWCGWKCVEKVAKEANKLGLARVLIESE